MSLSTNEKRQNQSSDDDYNDDFTKLQQKIQPKKSFFLLRWIAGGKPKPIIKHNEPYPLLKANILSKITFTWAGPVIDTGYLRRIENEDLYKLDGDLSVTQLTKKLESFYQKRLETWKLKNPDKEKVDKWVLILALNDTFKYQFWLKSGIPKVLADLTQVTLPLLVRAVVKFVQYQDDPAIKENKGSGVGYCIGIMCMLLLNSILISQFFHNGMLTGAQVKGVLTNIIYKKSFRLSTKSRLQFPNGKINSIVMADISRIDFCIGTLHFIWAFPFSFCVGIIILCVTLGAPALIGIAIILLVLASIFYMNKQLKKLRIKSTVFIDKRVRAINEIVNNLKMIKLYSWESAYLEKISGFRTNEKVFIGKIQTIKANLNAAISSVTYFSSLAVFLVMFYTSDNFEAYNIFSAITLFNMLRMPLNLLPMATSLAIDALLAMDRISVLLQAEESELSIERLSTNDSENSIEIENSEFQWEAEEQKLALTQKIVNESASEYGFPGLLNINLKIKRNEFIIITGSIGTGKTSLLNAIEGSMTQKAGTSKIFGSLTFCSYPWVQNATIQDNILFGLPLQYRKYNDIIKACALDVDFSVLPEGDQTEVGERGITLSGGQKARINLARAVYANSDIILLDDVLSAVDARVGKHIMEHCICGILANKTRVLATHQLSLIDFADRVIVLDGTGSIDIGTQSELLERNKAFSSLMEYSKQSQETEDQENEEAEDDEEENELEQLKSQISRIQTRKEEEEKKEMGMAEARTTASISMSIYARYLELGSFTRYVSGPLFFLVLAVNGFLQVFQSVWLSFWLNGKFDYSSATYSGLYALFICLATLSYIVMYNLMATVNNKAGLRLFNKSVAKLLTTPMWFMDVTPIGRILNRFTKDVDVLDTDMIEQLRLFLTSSSLVFATIILAGVYIPWFFISVPISFSIYIGLAVYYKASALDIKRLEAIKRSFVFSHFNESLSGMKVIKSYGSEPRFLRIYEQLIDNMNAAYYLTLANQRWLAVRLDLVSAIVTFFLSVLCVCQIFNVSGSSSGLLVSYMIQVSTMVSLMVRSMTQLENDFNSAERLFEYVTDLPEEAAFEKEDTKPQSEWPEYGAVNFENVSLSYREGLPLVLKDVSFDVKGGYKIGICGRTGAGKSTIMNALFRVNELATGKITIDGIDISTLGLHDLRSKLSLIPQDPVLFHGTIRENLDPFGESSDLELWNALRRSWLVEENAVGTGEYHQGENLKNFHKFHLDQTVEDDGANFSLGERQLLALARALVRNSKVLILDEATSSVDYETDAMIQSTIVNEFKHCTILCIAHRLKTILNYDLILVLDKGEVREYDTPYNLFKQGGIFSEMCERSHINESDFNK